MSKNCTENDFSRDFGATVPIKLNFFITPLQHRHGGLTTGVYFISTICLNEQEFSIDGHWHRLGDYCFGAVEADEKAEAKANEICHHQKGLTMPTKQELESQIANHNAQIKHLETMLEDVPTQIKQIKATIKLKKKALKEKE